MSAQNLVDRLQRAAHQPKAKKHHAKKKRHHKAKKKKHHAKKKRHHKKRKAKKHHAKKKRHHKAKKKKRKAKKHGKKTKGLTIEQELQRSGLTHRKSGKGYEHDVFRGSERVFTGTASDVSDWMKGGKRHHHPHHSLKGFTP